MSSQSIPIALPLLVAVLALYLIKRWAVGRSGKHLPPGPKPLPIVGNLFDMPPARQWEVFAEWKERWGDFVYINVLGQHTIIINSEEAAVDLLEKKSAIYSDRPILPMAGDLLKWNQQLVFSHYGDHFRNMRKLLYRYLGGRGQLDKLAPYHDLIEDETQRFLSRILNHSGEFSHPGFLTESIRKTSGSITLRMGYGYQPREGRDPVVQLVDDALEGFDAAAIPGSFLVDLVPALRWVPSWFPGAGWKRKALKWGALYDKMANVPFEMAKTQTGQGTAEDNIISMNVGTETTEEQEYHLKMAVSSLYAGGTDTTVSVISTFFLAMTLYPEIQKRAQQEIDAVIGSERLPSIDDREQLPYVSALVSEVFRWNPTIPLGIPHRSTEDDSYRGYFIPKGSVVIVNMWHLLRNPEIYSEPDRFKPERYLSENGKEPEQDPLKGIAFGFGRRICPGLNLAQTSVFATCAMVLATFNISKVVENGQEVSPKAAYGTGAVSHPLPFKCSIKPRSAKTESLILAGM